MEQTGSSAGAGRPDPFAPIDESGFRQAAERPRLDGVDAGARPNPGPVYAALDLGTNNCRLLIARQPAAGSPPSALRILESFCRIVRLGEGIASTGRLSDAAMTRTIEAMKVCGERMHARRVSRARLIATEACRSAANGEAFLARVFSETGLRLEIVDRETEAFLATTGCASLADPEAESIVLFDIGGGSSEIVWLDRDRQRPTSDRRVDSALRQRVHTWESMKVGVVTLAETFGGRQVTPETFEAMVAHVEEKLLPFAERVAEQARCARFHLLGTSGTVTTIAGVYLGLKRYDRRRVDGLWMTHQEVADTVATLRGMSYEERALNGCIGPERADLVLAGCAIFEAIRRTFPTERVRIADRGLREGILMQMMAADRMWSRDGF